MPRSAAVFVENNFSRGLITEATGLNFPENACTDSKNMFFDWTGRLYRRPGLDFENNHVGTVIARAQTAIVTFLWKNVAGNGNTTLFVMQSGATIYFWDVSAADTPSAGSLASTVTLSGVSGAPDITGTECQFTSGGGYLFISHPYCDPVYVTYSGSGTSATLAGASISILIRDLQGQTDTVASIVERPASLSDAHNYNLLNQGWTDGSHGDQTNTDFITIFKNGASASTTISAAVYPSNADIWWTMKGAQGTITSGTVSTWIDNNVVNNTWAPKGHFISTAFDFDPDTVSGITGLTVQSSGYYRPGCIAFYAGRVFYAGVQSPGYQNTIYFSNIFQQTISNPTTTFGQCYQLNDPTSQDNFSLLDDDGGTIAIPDAGTILRMVPMTGGLVVFATNGIWMITGRVGIGFTAVDYTIRLISTINAISGTSFVDIAGFPAWWNAEGMYILQGASLDQVTVQSLTNTTIKTFYDTIPLASKRFARGAFNVVTSEVYWVYSSAAPVDVNTSYNFDSVLTFNLLTGGFSPWTIDKTIGPLVNGIVVMSSSGGTVSQNQIVDASADTVQDAAGDNVVQFTIQNSSVQPTFEFLTSYQHSGSNNFTFSTLTNTSFLDWFTFNGVGIDAPAYALGGYKVHGQAQRKFTTNYIYLYSDAIPSSFTINSHWNYSKSSASGKWGTDQTVTFDSTYSNYTVAKYRLKIPGEGVALQYFIKSLPGINFSLIGWSVFDTANSAP